MTSTPSSRDRLLIKRLQTGEEAAFKEIYQLYATDLTAFAASKTFQLEIARDIIQDVFVSLWEKRRTLEVDNLKAYLFAMTRYRIIDHIRKNVTHETYAQLLETLPTTHALDGQQVLEEKELQQSIDNALDELSPRVKEVYLLSRQQHLSVSQIAEKLGVSEQTVKNQLTTALSHLRRSLPQLTALFFFLLG